MGGLVSIKSRTWWIIGSSLGKSNSRVSTCEDNTNTTYKPTRCETNIPPFAKKCLQFEQMTVPCTFMIKEPLNESDRRLRRLTSIFKIPKRVRYKCYSVPDNQNYCHLATVPFSKTISQLSRLFTIRANFCRVPFSWLFFSSSPSLKVHTGLATKWEIQNEYSCTFERAHEVGR